MREYTYLKNKEINWFAERVNESRTGRLTVNGYCVEKYRKLTGDTESSNAEVRDTIIRLTNGGCGV